MSKVKIHVVSSAAHKALAKKIGGSKPSDKDYLKKDLASYMEKHKEDKFK